MGHDVGGEVCGFSGGQQEMSIKVNDVEESTCGLLCVDQHERVVRQGGRRTGSKLCERSTHLLCSSESSDIGFGRVR